jgi:hypothetical protein
LFDLVTERLYRENKKEAVTLKIFHLAEIIFRMENPLWGMCFAEKGLLLCSCLQLAKIRPVFLIGWINGIKSFSI